MNHQEWFNNAWNFCVGAGMQTGIHPEIIFAQCTLESGWGDHAPQNNYFGIKGNGRETLTTVEYVAGKAIQLKAHFSNYSSLGDSVAGYARFIRSNERYRPFRAPGTIAVQLHALALSGYASDPYYVQKLTPIIDEIPSLEAHYASPLQVIKRLVSPRSITGGVMPVKGSQDVQPMSDLSKLISSHGVLFNSAADVIKALLPYAPLPAAVSTGIVDLVGGLQAAADNAGVVATGLEAPATASATSTPAPLPTAPVEAAPVDPGPAVTLSSAEVATLNAAISAGKAVLADAVQDLTNPAPGQTFIQTLEAQAIGEAETVGTVAVTEVGELAKGLLQPIAKPPTAN